MNFQSHPDRPSQRDTKKTRASVPEKTDAVEEASEESFPASDPAGLDVRRARAAPSRIAGGETRTNGTHKLGLPLFVRSLIKPIEPVLQKGADTCVRRGQS